MSIADLVVVVAGASKGIGKAIALCAARDGASVVINYLTDASAAEDLVTQIGNERALAVQADISKPSEIIRLVKETVARFGSIDVLIPNAAFVPVGGLRDITDESFDRAFAVNVKGPCFVAKEAVPYMKPGSAIIFISTDLADSGSAPPELLLYVSTKAALNQMTRIMAKELATQGIRVNAISPGATRTELFNKTNSVDTIQKIASRNPFNRIADPDEIAEAVSLLWKNESRWITGQVVKVNGGSP
ncbi:hypothetical protein N7471_013587 [Penicillium samsonianum]|uniref:uncharacterized protein n=1 Tax=Penicillium samsonianum TaxID=1882272 RepID=UPI002546C3B7|nr:uncharacterized protein N7471_013587 [Penicillium samsonianum]KAJ6118967.1 hypothetical protein N7471_013587 [Penicillium samsonianum]